MAAGDYVNKVKGCELAYLEVVLGVVIAFTYAYEIALAVGFII